jgi:hypothetical protein
LSEVQICTFAGVLHSDRVMLHPSERPSSSHPSFVAHSSEESGPTARRPGASGAAWRGAPLPGRCPRHAPPHDPSACPRQQPPTFTRTAQRGSGNSRNTRPAQWASPRAGLSATRQSDERRQAALRRSAPRCRVVQDKSSSEQRWLRPPLERPARLQSIANTRSDYLSEPQVRVSEPNCGSIGFDQEPLPPQKPLLR